MIDLLHFLAITSNDFVIFTTGWLDALTKLMVPLGILTAAVFGFLGFIKSRTNALKAQAQETRLDRQANRQEHLQDQITQVAIATPVVVPVPSP